MHTDDETNVNVDFNVSVVLPAGGCGERFGCQLPKQYSLLIDQPVILHTINAFHRIPWVKRIVVVVNQQFIAYMNQLSLDNELDKVVIVEGCSTRHRSIYAGVKNLAKDVDISSVVIIHDAVRPFIDEEVVRKIAVYAKTYGAAGVTRPLVSTVISADEDGMLRESLDRSLYCASEMPQGFQLGIIKTAYDKSTEYDFEFGTECLLLAMKYTGSRARLFTGPDNLWKVTYRKDLYAAEAVVKEQNIKVQIDFVACEENRSLVKALEASCRSKNVALEVKSCKESHKCNSVVFIYSELTASEISKNTHCVQTSLHTSCSRGPYLRPCIIHVYDGELLDQQMIFKFMKAVTEMVDKSSVSLVYGILNFNGPEYNQLSDMVTSLVWNRDACMSGQTFIIRKSTDTGEAS